MAKRSREILEIRPFHQAIVARMRVLSPKLKSGRARAVECASLIRTTACPKDRGLVRSKLQSLLGNFRKCKAPGRKLSPWDVAQFLGAIEALDIQDQDEEAKAGEGASDKKKPEYAGMAG